MESYINLSREELIEEIKRLKNLQQQPTASGAAFSQEAPEIKKKESSRMLANMIGLRKTMIEVLRLLLSSDQTVVIDEALLVILRFFEAERVYIGIIDETNDIVDFTHEVTSQGIVSMRDELLRQLPGREYPWWIENILSGNDIVIADVKDMPPAARSEQEILRAQGVLSLLTLPVYHQGKINGFIGLDAVSKPRAWNALDIENLRLLTDIISIAIERERVQHLMEYSARQMLMSEAKFQIIFDKMPLGVELYDETGTLLDINQADLNIFGVTKKQALGLKMFENPNIPESVNRQLKAGEDVVFSLDYNFQTVQENGYYECSPQTETKHLQVKGVPLKDSQQYIFGYLYIVSDDTENHHKAEQIRDNLAKLKVAVDTGDSIMWEYDVASEKLTVDFGLNDDLEGNDDLVYIHQHQLTCLQDFIETLHPDDRKAIYERRFLPLLRGEIENYTAVYRRILGDKIYWFNSNVRSYKFNPDGTPSKVVSYTSNITRQREREIELIKVKEADKLKSAFLANMSHEIRTPLNAIVGFSTIIAETDNKEEVNLYLDIIRKNNDLLLQLIDDILDFSKIEAGTLEYHFSKVDIKELCGEVALTDSLKVGPDVALIFDNNSPSVFLHTDAHRVVQVLSNFVNNAIKFTEKGSITISYRQENEMLKVSVTDTGVGIRPSDKARIFERFVKANSFKQGTGLGLTISKTIIEALGGTIGVDSEYGKGATFWFTLPLETEKEKTEEKKPEDEQLAQLSEARVKAPRKILIAEDIEENYLLLQTLLHKQYELYHAWNGKEAVDLFNQVHPDLVLMDIKMPVMNGFEATRLIRRQSATVPIIALTAFAFEKEKQRARECRFTDYLVKPVDIAELRKLVLQVFK